MILVREVMNCKPGQVGELIKKFRALGVVMAGMGEKPFRMYTDIAGEPFWTLVIERELASLDEVTASEEKIMSDGRARAAMEGYHELVLKGRRELYQVVA